MPNTGHQGCLSAGVASVDITPPVGTDLTGFIARTNPSTGIHDRLQARVLALGDGATQVLLIGCDLVGVDDTRVGVIRREIHDATGVPGPHVMIACSHTHSGPASMFLRGCGEIDAAWMAQLAPWLASAAQEALTAQQPTQITVGAIPVPNVSYNRRRPGAAVDPTLHIVRFDATDGPRAALLNFACHPVAAGSQNRLISADFTGVLTRAVEAETGATTLFVNGACGDINPTFGGGDLRDPVRGFDLADHTGVGLATGVLSAWPTLKPARTAALCVRRQRLRLPLRPTPSIDELTGLKAETVSRAAKAAGQPDKSTAALLGWIDETLEAVRHRSIIDSVPAELQAVALGDLAFIGVPGELFTMLGTQIKRRAPIDHALVFGYTNGNVGYIPTREAYAEGGYEVESAYRYYGYPAALAPEAGEHIVETALELIGRPGDEGCSDL